MAESFSREKLRQAPQKEGGWKNPVLPSSCVTPAGTSIEVQNEWEENTHTHTFLGVCFMFILPPALLQKKNRPLIG